MDLVLNCVYVIELFSFSLQPSRLSRPESTGLRHLAFEVNNLNDLIEKLRKQRVTCETIAWMKQWENILHFLLILITFR
ncbi:MAG: hypothetical protein ABIY62_08365 [Ginsengibacter sp.]